jgi:hypothetical protein
VQRTLQAVMERDVVDESSIYCYRVSDVFLRTWIVVTVGQRSGQCEPFLAGRCNSYRLYPLPCLSADIGAGGLLGPQRPRG